MPVWTAERDQRLLLITIDAFPKIDCNVLSQKYKEKFAGQDDYEPTSRAISEHIGALKKASSGGGKIWTAQRDQRLLLLLIDLMPRVDGKLLAEKYKGKFATKDDYKPTPRAITEHIGALKKAGGGPSTPGKVGLTTPTTVSKTVTPRKNGLTTPIKVLSLAKTPTSSAKRKRPTTMSEDEEEDEMTAEGSDAERELLESTPTKRRALSRRSKSVRSKSYMESVSGDSEDDAESVKVKVEKATTPTLTATDDDDGLNSFSFFDGAADVNPVDKMAARLNSSGGNIVPQGKAAIGGIDDDRVDDSDVSSFSNGR